MDSHNSPGAPREEPATLGQPELLRLLERAETLRQVVPDMVLVTDPAAEERADARSSLDQGRLLEDLNARFEAVLNAVAATSGSATNEAAPGKIVSGELPEVGVRQLTRTIPLEVAQVELPSGQLVRVPTPGEVLRIQAYLVICRNEVRDYLDVAQSARANISRAAEILSEIDEYYSDPRAAVPAGVATQLARQLADPRPADRPAAELFDQDKQADRRWTDWKSVTDVCRQLAIAMVK
jgi:hypothetical protein